MHFRLSAVFGLNLGCHFSDIFSFPLAESPAVSQLDWLLEELTGHHNPHRSVNAEPEFLVSDLQLENDLRLCLP
jgi:hypothetical protein